MLSVASLLNPLPEAIEPPSQLPSPTSTLYSSESSPRLVPTRKQKLCKDEAIFVKGKPQGEVRYWPYEYQDEQAAVEHREYQVYPKGRIAEYCRHVPYHSEKKSFLTKTGREGFHVFQYTFKMPNEDKKQTVMWDYNIGLVRVTPFFKALEYPKTSPARMLGKNPGLKEICHSITGGSLTAQGYWMPYEAAKAVAATFCYRIRYVLTPIFGPDFPSRCIVPGTPGFDSMQVAPSIIRDCADAARDYKDFSRESSVTSNPRSPLVRPVTRWTPANLRPKTLKTLEPEACGRTNIGCDKPYFVPSQKSKKCGLQMLRTPRSVESHRYQHTDLPKLPIFSPCRESSVSSQETGKQKRCRAKKLDYQEDSSSSSEFSLESPIPPKRKKTSTAPAMTEESAARRLLELYLVDSALKKRASGTRITRRASS